MTFYALDFHWFVTCFVEICLSALALSVPFRKVRHCNHVLHVTAPAPLAVLFVCHPPRRLSPHESV